MSGEIFCRLQTLSDGISRYSEFGHECLNPDLANYIDLNLFYVPDGVPIVIRFSGKALSDQEKETIRETLLYRYRARASVSVHKLKQNMVYSILTLVLGALLLFLYFRHAENAVTATVLNLLLWFFFWEFGVSAWTQNISLRKEIRHAKRVLRADIEFEASDDEMK